MSDVGDRRAHAATGINRIRARVTSSIAVLGEPKMEGQLHVLLPFAAIIAVVLFLLLFVALWILVAVLSGFKLPNDKTLPAVLTASISLTALIGASLGAIYAFRRQVLAEQEGLRAHQQVYSDRYVKAAELLAHERPSARLAGLHSLAVLADDWVEGRGPCVMAICSYLRLPSLDFTKGTEDLGEREVQRTAWRSLRSRLLEKGARSWHDQELDFSGGRFTVVDLDQVDLDGVIVQFRNCTFQDGEIRLQRTTITGGVLDFSGSTFRNMKIRLSGMKLEDGADVLFDKVVAVNSSFEFDRMDIKSETSLLMRSAELTDSRLLFDSDGDPFYLGSRYSRISGAVEFDNSVFRQVQIYMHSYSLSGRLVFSGVETEDVELSIPHRIHGNYVNLDVRPTGPTKIRIGPGFLAGGDLRIRPVGDCSGLLDVDVNDFELRGGELRVNGAKPCWKAFRVDLTGEQQGRLVVLGPFPAGADVDIDQFAEVRKF